LNLSDGTYSNIYEKLNEAGKVKIWVNPQKPSESVIVNGFDNSRTHIIVLLALGLVSTLLVYWMVIADLKTKVDITNWAVPTIHVLRLIMIILYMFSFYRIGLMFYHSSDMSIEDRIETVKDLDY